MTIFTRKRWSPFLAGGLIGVLSWFSFATVDNPLGITSAFESTAAMLVRPVDPAHSYFLNPDNQPRIDWEWMLVVGVLLGALLSAWLSGDRDANPVPRLWRARFGASPSKRLAAAFAGGAVMMFGARIAQGCTSGHGISGALQLAVSSWIFLPALFLSAVATAFLLYGRKGIDHV